METVLTSDPTGLHRVLDDAAVLPQAAQRLDTRRELWPDEVRVRVEGVHDGRPVLLQQPGEDVDQRLVRVRTCSLQRGVVGDDGTQHEAAVPPEAGQPGAAAPGVHRGVEEDQLDPADAVGQDVHLGPVAAVQGRDRVAAGLQAVGHLGRGVLGAREHQDRLDRLGLQQPGKRVQLLLMRHVQVALIDRRHRQ